jgi:hypothetical protein
MSSTTDEARNQLDATVRAFAHAMTPGLWDRYYADRDALVARAREEGAREAQEDAKALHEFLRLLLRDRDALIERAVKTLADGIIEAYQRPLAARYERLNDAVQEAHSALSAAIPPKVAP